MFSSSVLKRLRQSYGLEALPDAIDIPAIGGGSARTVPIEQATIDEIELALISLARQQSALYRLSYALDSHGAPSGRLWSGRGHQRRGVRSGGGQMSAPFGKTPLRIITADERLRETRGIKGVLTGIAGIGKTSQLWTLDPERTLFVNLEAGELAVQGWPGSEIRIRDWELARDIAAWIGGPNPAMRDDQPYGAAHHARVVTAFGPAAQLDKYETVFVDSISVASRICLQWCKGQPQAQSDRTGKLDLRATYGLLGQEMIGWLTHLQHTPAKNIWLVGLLDRKLDDFGRPFFSMQIEGSKTGLELPGIVDEVITLTELRPEKGDPFRAFVCTTINDYGLPAKDRSGRLSMIEPAHLSRLMTKIGGPLPEGRERLNFDLPPGAASQTPTTTRA